MDSRIALPYRFISLFIGSAALLLLCLCASTSAQTAGSDYAPEDAPPPLRYIPNEVRDQINAQRNLKGRTKLLLTLTDERLKRAEQLTAERRFADASAELGIYQALVEENARSLDAAQRGGADLRDRYRKLEVALRSYRARLELLSRSTSSSYRVHLTQISDDTWRIRTQVLNRFFGDEVLSDERTNAPDEPDDDEKTRPRDTNNRTAPDDRN